MEKLWRFNLKEEKLKLIFVLIFIIIVAFIPLLLKSQYYLHLLIIAYMNAILAMTFIIVLKTGVINLCIAAFWGIGAYASAVGVMKLGLSFWLAMPITVIVTSIIAFGTGCLVLRTPGFGFLILTAVINMAVVQIFGNIRFLGGFEGIDGIPPPDAISLPFLFNIEFTSKITCYYMILSLMFIVILILLSLYNSWIGWAWEATGLNPALAESLGIDTFWYRITAFTISAAIDGLMGSFYAHYMYSITPNDVGILKTIHIHVYAILGGIEFPIAGPILGSIVMTFLPELLRITERIEPIFTGLFMILLIIFLPKGVLGIFQRGKNIRGSRVYYATSL